MTEKITSALEAFADAVLENLLPVVFMLLVGLLIIRIAMNIVGKILEKSKLEQAGKGLIKSVLRAVLYVLLGRRARADPALVRRGAL